jgi:hypothetical protein
LPNFQNLKIAKLAKFQNLNFWQEIWPNFRNYNFANFSIFHFSEISEIANWIAMPANFSEILKIST